MPRMLVSLTYIKKKEIIKGKQKSSPYICALSEESVIVMFNKGNKHFN